MRERVPPQGLISFCRLYFWFRRLHANLLQTFSAGDSCASHGNVKNNRYIYSLWVGRMNCVYRMAATLLLLTATGMPAWAQVADPANLRGDSTQTRKRLTEAEQKLTAGKTADATDDLQRIMDEASTDLVSWDAKHYRTALWRINLDLARLPPDALKNYQDQIEIPARKLLEAGKRTRDTGPLWQLVDRYFVSRPADEGLLLLGDILFERGEFRTAELLWHRLIPDGNADIAYPDSKADPAQLHARIVLAAFFAGDTDRAKAGLSAFQAKFPNAKGTLAGKDGLLAAILAEQLKTTRKPQLSTNDGANWLTFGGGSDHSSSVGVQLPREWRKTPMWEKALPTRFSNHTAYGHPVVTNGQVFVTDGLQLLGFDLLTGKTTVRQTIFTSSSNPFSEEKSAPDPCPSLTIAGGMLYVRTGPFVFKALGLFGNARMDDSTIACYALRPDLSEGVKELWKMKPPGGDGKSPIMWEGAPQVSGRRMWAAYARVENGRIVHGVACYDPADTTVEPDHPAWVVDICDSPITVENENRIRQELVTLAGRNVVFCSNTGAVVALDAATGRRAWAFRYPRSRKGDAGRSVDPTPAVAYGGRLFVAPTDGEHVYALDPETGEKIWESSGSAEGIQIVGVSAGKLIISVSRPVRGIRALNVGDGSYLGPQGWVQDRYFVTQNCGRGFVTDDRILWPTPHGLLTLHTDDGTRDPFTLYNPFELTGMFCGNIVYADGVLIVVTPTHIFGYFSDSKRFGPPPEKTETDPIRLQFNRLTTQAEQYLADGKPELARSTLIKVALSDLPLPFRAWAAARLLLLTPKVDAESKLPQDIRGVLTSELRAEWVIPANGIPTTLDDLILQHLGREPTIQPLATTQSKRLKQEEKPQLSPDAEIEQTLQLPRGSTPLYSIPGSMVPKNIYLTTTSELHTVSRANGTETRHRAVALFTHVAETFDGFIVAGPYTIAIYGSDPTPVWVFHVPTTDPLPSRSGEFRMYTDGTVLQPELSSFQICSTWLVARLGERYLIAFDLHNRRVAWVLGTDGRSHISAAYYPDALRFGSAFFMNARFIAVQLSDGRMWFVRTETGRVLDVPGFGKQTVRLWWTLPPALVGTNHLAVADNPGAIRLLSLISGRVVWTHFDEKRESSLTGEPPQIRVCKDVLLVAISRNHGVEVDRLNLENGKSEWKNGAVFLDIDRLNLADADFDADRVYLTIGDAVIAIELKTGEKAWEAKLPDLHGERGWAVRAGQKCVIVYPLAAIPREPIASFWDRMIRTLQNKPEVWRLPGLLVGLYDAWITRSFPVLMLDQETGRLHGKVEIPAIGPVATIYFERNMVVVATGERVCWLK